MIFSVLRYPLTVQGDTLGSPVTLTIPAKGRSLTLHYRCGSRRETIAVDNTEGIFRWTPPLSLAQEYPGDNRIPVTLILEQYRKGILAASRQEQILLRLPGEISPQVLLRYSDAMGYRQTYGGFVQGKSRLTLTAQAQGTFGAEIRKTELSCGGLTGWGNSLTFELPQAGEIPLTARVWDGRLRQAEASAKVQVLPYAPPEGEILTVSRGEAAIVRFRGRVSDLGGKNQGTFTVLLKKEGEEDWQRFPGGQGVSVEEEITVPMPEGSWTLALEAKDDFEVRVFPYAPAPFLDLLPRRRALGIGCPAEKEQGVCLNLPLDMKQNRVENLGPPQEQADAVSLGYAEEHYFHPRLLWENPAPGEAFPAQTLNIAGDFLLIEAAVEAGKAARFWELGKDTGLLRAAEGVQRPVSRTEGGLTFGTTANGDLWAVPLRVYGLQGGT